MLIRALFFFVPSTLGILAYEFTYFKYFRGKTVSPAVGFMVLLLFVISRFSAFFLGAILALPYCVPFGPKAGRMMFVLSGVLALYIFAILIQVAQNLVRLALGAPTHPISWIRSMKPSKRRK